MIVAVRDPQTESPSQLSTALIQSTWVRVSSAFVAASLGMRTASYVESCEPTASTHIRWLSSPE